VAIYNTYDLPLWDEWCHPNDITSLNWVPIHKEKENEKTNHGCKVPVFSDKNKQYPVTKQSWKTINNSIFYPKLKNTA